MVKLETIKDFTLKDYEKLENVKSKGARGHLYVGDTFECDEEMAKYLMGENVLNEIVAKVIEIVPEEEKELYTTEEELKQGAEEQAKMLMEQEPIKEEKPNKKKNK